MNQDEFRHSSSGRVINTQKGYWAFVPNPLPLDIQWSFKVISALFEADRDLSRLNRLAWLTCTPMKLASFLFRNLWTTRSKCSIMF